MLFILTQLLSTLIQTHGQSKGKCYLINPAFNSGSTIGTWMQCNNFCPTSYPGVTMLCVNNAAENAWMLAVYGAGYCVDAQIS